MSVTLGRAVFAVAVLAMFALEAEDWPHWRGPQQNGISGEKDLPETFDLATKENVLWVNEDFGGRAAPVVLQGRLYLNARTLDDFNDKAQNVHAQQQVICLDANTGKLLWKDVFNVAQTDIPAPRIGWASMVGDPETGLVYLHSVDGWFRCYDKDGKVQWEHQLFEEYGKISGYGGRTQTPLIDEDRIILNFLEVNWGKSGPPSKCSYFAFDKRTGDLLWKSTPGGQPQDTTYSNAFVDVIDGTRMLIGGHADGGVYAMQARTGKPIWGHVMSRRGLNMTPVSDGQNVYISHGEDNTDAVKFGSVRAVPGTSKGTLTSEQLVWRVDDIKAGYSALLVVDGVLYVTTDTGKLIAMDAKTGKVLWNYPFGTVGKGAPVYADGKIYIMEVNGNVHILRPSREKAEVLSHVTLPGLHGQSVDEIYASPAVADGKVYLVTRDRIICLAKKDAKGGGPSTTLPDFGQEKPVGKKVAQVQLTPFEVILAPGQSQKYQVRLYDENGGFIGARPAENIAIEPIQMVKSPTGEMVPASPVLANVAASGDTVTASKEITTETAGYISVTVDGIKAEARLRVFPPLPWKWTFDDYKGKQVPATWVAARGKLTPAPAEGGGQMMKNVAAQGRPSTYIWMGPPWMSGYTLQTDLMAKEDKARRLPNVGVTVQKYNMMLKGNNQKVQVVSWAPHLRASKEEKFRWDPGVWYTMKFRVDVDEQGAHLRGKVWKRDDQEPEAWTIEFLDPHPNREGSAGIYIYALGETESYYDNVTITPNGEAAAMKADPVAAAEARKEDERKNAAARAEGAKAREAAVASGKVVPIKPEAGATDKPEALDK